jgi:drug/metabolite transporter (DMT)-like permease
MRTLPKLVLLALLTVYVVWGSTYLAIRYALVSFPPFLQMGTRFLAAGLLLYLYQKWRGAPDPTPRQWRDGAVVGILLLAGGTGVVAYAEQTVSSSLTAVFIAASPLMFALWSGWFGKWPNRTEWLGIAIGFCGVALLASGAGLAGQPEGILALCVAITCWSFGSILSQTRLKLAPGAMGFASEMLAGGAFLMAVSWLRGETVVLPLDAKAVIAWVYLVTVGSMLAFSAYMYVLSKVPPAMASSYAYVNPVIAVALGVGLAGESITLRETVAMAIILGSVVLMTRAKAAPVTKSA